MLAHKKVNYESQDQVPSLLNPLLLHFFCLPDVKGSSRRGDWRFAAVFTNHLVITPPFTSIHFRQRRQEPYSG